MRCRGHSVPLPAEFMFVTTQKVWDRVFSSCHAYFYFEGLWATFWLLCQKTSTKYVHMWNILACRTHTHTPTQKNHHSRSSLMQPKGEYENINNASLLYILYDPGEPRPLSTRESKLRPTLPPPPEDKHNWSAMDHGGLTIWQACVVLLEHSSGLSA